MAINKENFIIVYVLEDSIISDSESFANYYANIHDMDTTSNNPSGNSGTTSEGIYWQVDGQKVGIKMEDTSEILSEGTFNKNLLNPLREALSSSDLLDMNVWGIVLGYKIPGGYNLNSNNIISSTSRISRINHTFSAKYENELFNRKVFSRFDSSDAEKALIVSRIDAPNLLLAKQFVNNAEIANKQLFANGIFYIDPYSDKIGSKADDYTDLMLEFSNLTLPSLNLSIYSTSFIDPYIDSIIPFVNDDSFTWSWFTDRASSSFFRKSNAIRGFFYNADYDGGFTMRDVSSNRWPFLAMDAGYIATAGAMSNPSIEGLLNLRPFFESLKNGSTIGEAMIFSTPFLDWTISFFGDPLVKIFFPAQEEVDSGLIDENESWRLQSIDLSRNMSYLYKKEKETEEAFQLVVDTQNIEIEEALLDKTNQLFKNNKEENRKSQLIGLVEKFIEYPQRQNLYTGLSKATPDINDYLSEEEYKLSELITEVVNFQNPIDSENILEEGYWEFEFELLQQSSTFAFYNFRLLVSDDKDFLNIIFNISSENGQIGNWLYEKEENEFIQLLANGIPSNFKGRRIRYQSKTNQFLNRGQVYYFKITQVFDDGNNTQVFSPRIFKDIIWT